MVAWEGLDDAWKAAFDQAWETFTTGNIGVGAVVTSPDGSIVAVGRNRVTDTTAPPGQVHGSSVAHAEINALCQLPFGQPKDLTLT